LHQFVAPLDIDVVLEIPYWTKTHDSFKIMCDNVENTICELSLHGPSTYSFFLCLKFLIRRVELDIRLKQMIMMFRC